MGEMQVPCARPAGMLICSDAQPLTWTAKLRLNKSEVSFLLSCELNRLAKSNQMLSQYLEAQQQYVLRVMYL